MNECAAVQRLLSLYPGGELDPKDIERVEAHLARCVSCGNEAEKFSQVISIARQVSTPDLRLPDSVCNRIAQEAAERASARPWGFPAIVSAFSVRPGLLATATAILLALVAVPAAMRHAAGPSKPPDVSTIRITTDGDAVRLAWTDGTRDSYRVYKSNNPRDLARAEVHVVKGNVWVDSQPESSQIVYYKIE